MPQLKALTALSKKGIPRNLHPATRRVLLERQWARLHQGTVLIITAEGRAALVTVYPHVSLFLARKSGYTTTVDHLDAGEVVDTEAFDHWVQEAELSRLEARIQHRRNRLLRARALARCARAA